MTYFFYSNITYIIGGEEPNLFGQVSLFNTEKIFKKSQNHRTAGVGRDF